MEQRVNYAAVKDARIKFRKEECANGTEQISYHDHEEAIALAWSS